MIAERFIGRQKRLWVRLETIFFWYNRVFAGVSRDTRELYYD